MKTVDSPVNNGNRVVHLSGKYTNKSLRTSDNPTSQNILSSKKKYALLPRVYSYDNVYSQKPIIRRKLAEKYSTARYNFNSKRIYSTQTVRKKKFGDSSYSSGKRTSKNTRYHVNSAVIIQNSITDPPAQSSEKSSFNNRHETVINSLTCGVAVPKRDDNYSSTHDEEDGNPKAESASSRLIPNCFEKEKTSEHAPAHAECKLSSSAEICAVSKPESTFPAGNSKSTKNRVFLSDLRALMLSKADLTESTGALANSEAVTNLKTIGSSLHDGEDSDSDESTYLTISYDGDSDSRLTLLSDEFSEESYDTAQSNNEAALSFQSESNLESPQKAEMKDVGESTAKEAHADKPPDTDASVTVANLDTHLGLKRSLTTTAPLKLPDSDSDSGLQLCSSDGEKSSPDQLPSEGQKIDCAQLLAANVEKWHEHPFYFKNANDWVNNSSQNPSQSKLDSGSNVPASSAQILCNDYPGELLSSDFCAVSPDKSVDVISDPTIVALSSCDSDKKAETTLAENLLTGFESMISGDSEMVDDSNQKQVSEHNTKSPNCDTPEKSSLDETAIQSTNCKNNSRQDSVSCVEATINEHEKRLQRWKLVPSSIYQHFFQHYKTQEKDMPMPMPMPMPVKPKKKRKKSTWKNRRGYMRGSFLAEKVPEKTDKVPFQDPYVNVVKDLDFKKEPANEFSEENIGMIVHVGVNRPLFPEIYRNIVTLNEKTDGEITNLWANFALTTLITDESSKRFKSVFLPVKDSKLKSAIGEYQKKTCCEFQEVELQKVTFVGSPERDITDDSPGKHVCARKRKIVDGFCESNQKPLSPEFAELSPKKQKIQKFYKVNFPTVQISALNSKPAVDVKDWKTAGQRSISATEYPATSVQRLGDEALLAKHGCKPCWVLLPKISIPPSIFHAEEDEEDEDEDEEHFFGADHCSRTYGQMLDYRFRNHSLVFFHRIKRILCLQGQNNKLFRACRYVHLRPDIGDEFDEVNLLDDCPDSIIDSKPFPAEVTKNPVDILKTWKLNAFEAPLLKGIDVNTNKFSIRFMNHLLLKSETNAKWLILQLNKSMLNVIHQSKNHLPVEMLFQIICRADLTKKVVCNTIGTEFDPDVLNFGVYGVPGLCEAVLVGPYESREMQHNLTATVQLWNGEIACVPIMETSFDRDTFFLCNEETKVRSVYGLWWKPGDAVPCTSAANSAFINHLFDPVDSEPSIERSVKVQPLLMQHPCLSYSKYERAGRDVNIRLIHQASKLNYTASGLTVSERMAIEDFIVDDTPLLQMTKLRSRTNKPNYCEMASPKRRIPLESRCDLSKGPKIPASTAPVRVSSISKRAKMYSKNERSSHQEFSVLRSNLGTAVSACKDASLVAVLNRSEETMKRLVKDENALKFSKRRLLSNRQKLITKLRANMKQFPHDHLCHRYTVELISNLGKADRAENFARNRLSKLSTDSSNHAVTANIDSNDVTSVKSNEEPTTIESSSQNCIVKSSKQHFVENLGVAVASNSPKINGTRNVNNCLKRKVIESRLEPCQKPQQFCQQSSPLVYEKFEILSPEELIRWEHSYAKSTQGSRGRWVSIPRKECQKLPWSPSLPVVDCKQQATKSSEEHEQVAVYLIENETLVTKLIIQRLKSANKYWRNLPLTERRNQIIALIRKVVRETLTGMRRQTGASNPDDRIVIPQLLLLQRLLESANKQIKDSSMIRVSEETIEISDDDEDEFSIVPTCGPRGAAVADDQMFKRRVHVRVSSASSVQSNSSPLLNGVRLTNSLSSDRTARQTANDSTTVIDEQLFVESQIILNSVGDQVDISAYVDIMPPPKPSSRRRGRSDAGQRKLTVLKRVDDSVRAEKDNSTEVNPSSRSPPSNRVDSNKKMSIRKIAGSSCDSERPSNENNVTSSLSGVNQLLNRREVGSSSPRINQLSNLNNIRISVHGVPQTPRVTRLPDSEVRLLRSLLRDPVPHVLPKTPLVARKTFSSPNFRKLIAERRARVEALSPPLEIDCESTDTASESSDLPVDGSQESSISISDYIHIHPDLLDKPLTPKRSPVAKFTPNILVKSCKVKDLSGNMIVVPLNGKKVSLPLVLNKRLPVKERLRCPSFVPPSSHSTSLLQTVAKRQVLPVIKDAVSLAGDNANTDSVDDFGAYFENGSPIDKEPPTVRRSSTDSSTRLAIKSFASVHSFNDNCFNNMDRMLKF